MAPDIYRRELLEAYSNEMRQFIDFRSSVLPNGMRQIEAYNGTGLTFTLLPDRGLDIWTAHYNGKPLTWISQNSPHPPDFGKAWVSQFNGGLMVTCGLTYMGHPETDDITGEFHSLHGPFSRLRAEDVSITRGWQGERYVVELSAVIVEAELFGPQLRFTRKYRIVLGEPTIEVSDSAVNLGDSEIPCMWMYHCNLGYPLVGEGARLISPHQRIVPTTDQARGGIARWDAYDAPILAHPEQVFWHHLKAGADGRTEVALVRGDLGFALDWDTAQMPYITQWKNFRQGQYVCGVEPSTALPEGRNRPRRGGRLATLKPGASREAALRISILDGAQAIAAATQRIDRLQQQGTPVSAPALNDYPD